MILTTPKEGKFHVVLIQTDNILYFQNWWPNFYKKTIASEETKILKKQKGKR